MSDERVAKAEFDQLCRDKAFTDGPHVSTFGDGPGDPYQPHRELWGTLADGTRIESSTDPEFKP